MNSQQQQHSLMNHNSGVMPGATSQRSMMAQRTSSSMAPSKSVYQMQQSSPLAQVTHFQMQQQQSQQQPQQIQPQPSQQQMVNMPSFAMAPGQRQKSPETLLSHQYANSIGTSGGTLSTQNGRMQGVTGSALHSSFSLDSNQLSLSHQPQQGSHLHQYQQQHQQSSQQPPQQHLLQHSYQQQQSVNQQHQLQHRQNSPNALNQQQMQMQSHQQQSHQPASHHQTTAIQHSQASFQKQQQQNLQIQQHLHQRSLHQQQRQQQKQQQSIQPKQILQNPSNAKASMMATQQQQQLTGKLLEDTKPSVVVLNGQAEKLEDEKDESDHAELSKPEKPLDEEREAKENITEKLDLANTKEKTPMCLINELARFNKMSHQYTLVDEQGPAHRKTFYVKLKLGEEEYSASGESIKKAQHAAAAIALVETKHTHPLPKQPRHAGTAVVIHPDENLTPTVELNALAMKRGEAAMYKAIEPQQPPYYPQPGMDYRGMYNQRYHQYNMRTGRDPRGSRGGGVLWPMRYHYPRVSRAFYVSLRVGHREFIGDGPTRQAARHNAAQKALRILKALPIPAEAKKTEEVVEDVVEETINGLKSEISLVHEIALRRNMPVTFEVVREAGPPHMKNFITKCTVADKVTEGEGNSKKTSKKKAAELMLEYLQKLPPSPAPAFPRPKAKMQLSKKKNRNLIKSELQQQKADPNYGVGINPISRLIQIMQAQKKKEPVYTLVSERGLPRRREFIMQVEVEDKSCTGSGPNKKLAKRSAAESMLQMLGYTKPSPQPTKSSIKQSSSGEGGQGNGDKKVKFVVEVSDQPEENGVKGSSSDGVSFQKSQQKVPGLIHLPSQKNSVSVPSKQPQKLAAPTQPREPSINLSNILKPNLRPEIQLRELCKAMDYELEIDDFTKKRAYGTEHITQITVGFGPGQRFHGSNTTLESSRDQAAMDALKVLLAKVKDVHPAGDGPLVKKELLTRTSIASKKDMTK